MTGLEKIEYEKCLNDPHYFFDKYVVVKNKRMIREDITGDEFKDVEHIYHKYYARDPSKEILRSIEKVTDLDDGDCDYIIRFNHNPYVSSVGLPYNDVIRYLRKDKIKKICQKGY